MHVLGACIYAQPPGQREIPLDRMRRFDLDTMRVEDPRALPGVRETRAKPGTGNSREESTSPQPLQVQCPVESLGTKAPHKRRQGSHGPR